MCSRGYPTFTLSKTNSSWVWPSLTMSKCTSYSRNPWFWKSGRSARLSIRKSSMPSSWTTPPRMMRQITLWWIVSWRSFISQTGIKSMLWRGSSSGGLPRPSLIGSKAGYRNRSITRWHLTASTLRTRDQWIWPISSRAHSWMTYRWGSKTRTKMISISVNLTSSKSKARLLKLSSISSSLCQRVVSKIRSISN